MKDILEKIIAHKQLEVAGRKGEIPVRSLEASIYFERSCIPLTHFILHESKSGIIAEFKRQSPSKGIINGHSQVFKTLQNSVHNQHRGVIYTSNEE